MKNVRIWFKKKGSAKYISHLDLTRCMSRGLKLSGLPVWYTEGFNPRIYMTFAMPLSLGVTGERECMDIRLNEEVPFPEITQRLHSCLPRDIEVFHAAEPLNKLDEVEFADYEIRLEAEKPEHLAKQIEDLLSKEEITVIKHGKKGDKEVDIKPYFSQLKMEKDRSNALLLSMRLPCGQNGSVNPSLFLEALKNHEGAEPYGEIIRKRLLTKDFSEIT